MTRTGAREPIALTVIGGFLGAGKTTLLNRLLRDAGDRRLAVLVNDFGAINIDARLVQSREGDMISLKNGCICCGISGDFIGELALLRDRDDPPEHVVVEASGVADPGAIVGLGDMPGYRRDAAVIVADAETVRARAADETTGPLVKRQLRAGDLIVLNKSDLVSDEQLAQVHAWLRELAGPSTAIVQTSFGTVPVDVALGARPPVKPPDDRPQQACGDADQDDAGHEHAEHRDFETWSWSGDAPLSGAGLVAALKALPDGIVRAKGLLHLREDPQRRYILQLVGRRYSIEADRAWGEVPPQSQLVVIGLPGSVDGAALTSTVQRLTAAPGA
ncbi:MAG: GTP-binding protein [Actinobacteria bacterium]|nr:GTP-binding protein [Actinomycetota bacterium]